MENPQKMTAKEVAEIQAQAWLVPYEQIKGSFRLAMESAGLPAGTIEEVLLTVEDFAVNNLGDE